LFLTNALVLLVILCLLVFIADVSTRFDEYTLWGRNLATASQGKAPDGLAGSLHTLRWGVWLLAEVWLPRLLVLSLYLLGPTLIGAMGFTCAQLVKYREVLAVLAGGQSLWRVARPMLVCAVMVVGSGLVLRETVLPRVATLLPRAERDVARAKMQAMQPRGTTAATAAGPQADVARAMGTSTRDFVLDGQGRLLYVREFDLATSVARGLVVIERDAQGLMQRRISADRATWTGNAWKLENGRALDRPSMQEASQGSVWAGQRVGSEVVTTLVTDVDPTVLKLRRYESLASNLSTSQLSQVIHRYLPQQHVPQIARRIESLERTRLARFASAACVLLTFVTCLPFFLRKEPTNMLRQSLLCAPVAAGGLLAATLGVMFVVPGLPVWLGVCTPLALLVPGAIAAVSSVRS
jgi:lipopolysaccharide export system permease protein